MHGPVRGGKGVLVDLIGKLYFMYLRNYVSLILCYLVCLWIHNNAIKGVWFAQLRLQLCRNKANAVNTGATASFTSPIYTPKSSLHLHWNDAPSCQIPINRIKPNLFRVKRGLNLVKPNFQEPEGRTHALQCIDVIGMQLRILMVLALWLHSSLPS